MARLIYALLLSMLLILTSDNITASSFEPRHGKTCHQDFQPGKTQTGLLSYRDKLES